MNTSIIKRDPGTRSRSQMQLGEVVREAEQQRPPREIEVSESASSVLSHTKHSWNGFSKVD